MPGEAANAEHLALVQRERDVVDAGQREMLDLERRRTLRQGGQRRVERIDALAGHECYRPVLVEFREGAHVAPAAEHRDPVRDALHLFPAMRGEHDGAATLAQAMHPVEQPGNLALDKGGGRLVEEQYGGFVADRAHDLDDLPLGQRDVLGEGERIDVLDAHAGHDCLGLLGRAPTVDQAERPARLTRDHQVLGDGHPGEKRELLEHRPGAEPVGALRSRE